MIELIRVTKDFGKLCAVDNVNLCVEEGDLFGLLGPNGAGKSTILNMITGLLEPTHGHIIINKKDLKLNKKRVLRSIGVVFENPSFYEYLTGKENLVLLARLKGNRDQKEIERLLNITSLSNRANNPVKKYSFGMKQRLALACALISNPDILILDEPTNGLDPEGIHTILNLLNDFSKRKKKTIVISSHQVYDVESICNKIAIINKGVIQCEGKLDNLLQEDGLSCLITTQDREKCKILLADQPWVQNFKFINRKKSLQEFYMETIKKVK